MSGTQVVAVLAAAVLGSFVKAVTGMGFPLLAVPLATLAVGVEDAVVVFVLPNMLANAVLCLDARDARGHTRDLRALLLPGLLATLVGTVALVQLPEEPILALLLVTIVVFLVNSLVGVELHLDPDRSRRWAPAVGVAAGVMQGAVGISGPVVAGWYQAYRLPSRAFVYTVTLVFGVTGTVQVAVLAVSGEFTGPRLLVSAAVLVPVLLTLPLGRSLRSRLGGPGFDAAVLGVIAVSGVAVVGRLLS